MRRAWTTGMAWWGIATLTVVAFAAPPRDDFGGEEIAVPENVGPIRSFFRTLAPKMAKPSPTELDSETPRKTTGFWKERTSSMIPFSSPSPSVVSPKPGTTKSSASPKPGTLHSYSIPNLPRVITPSRPAMSSQELARLATQACACHPEAKRALIAALTSSKEDLRYEAIQAVLDHVNHRCQRCDRALCRDDVIASIVADMAYGRDSSGQSLERSELVRSAARDVVRAAHKTRADSLSRSTPNATLRDSVDDDIAPRPGIAAADDEPARSLPATNSATRFVPAQPSVSSTVPQAPESAPRFIQPGPSSGTFSNSSRTGIGFANPSRQPEPSVSEAPIAEPVAPAPSFAEPARPAPRQPALKTTKSAQPFANRVSPPPVVAPEPVVEPPLKPTTEALGPTIESAASDELPAVQRLTPDGRPTSRRVNPPPSTPSASDEPSLSSAPQLSPPAASVVAPDETATPTTLPAEPLNPYTPSARRKNSTSAAPSTEPDTATPAANEPVLAPRVEKPAVTAPITQPVLPAELPKTVSPSAPSPSTSQPTPAGSTRATFRPTPALPTPPASSPSAVDEPTPTIAPDNKNLGEPTLAPPINRSSGVKFGTPKPAAPSMLPSVPTTQKLPLKPPLGATVWVKG